jgi:hypothetical protein
MTEKNGKEGQNFVSWVFWYGMQLWCYTRAFILCSCVRRVLVGNLI